LLEDTMAGLGTEDVNKELKEDIFGFGSLFVRFVLDWFE